MSLYPKNVEIKEENINNITSLFKKSYKRVIKEIETATDFGIANRKAILKQIDETLKELSGEMQDLIDKELPKYYKSGADNAISQLHNIGADVQVATGFNKLHKEAIVALVDDTVRSYNEAITGVKRSADLLLGRSFREMVTNEIAFGQITGESLVKMRRNIKGILKEKGLSAITDKSGRKWQLDTYAEMLYRTKAVEARNIGLSNRLAENGYDLVQVSSHVTSCPICAPWQGKIISITGNTKGYPTLADAEADGLFHPNAVLDGTTFIAYGELNEMIGANYKGPAIRITTSEGYSITIGPNHPILTNRGMIKANVITKSDKLVYDSRVITPNSIINSNFKNMPIIEDIFESLLLVSGDVSEISPTSNDFHGDRIFCKGKIKVIKPASYLLPIFDSMGIENFRNGGFMTTNMQFVFHSGNSPRFFNTETIDLSPSSKMGGALLSPFIFLHINNIIHIPCYNGKAYDATTTTGIYNNNGFVVSNCRHAINALIPSLASETMAYNTETGKYDKKLEINK